MELDRDCLDVVFGPAVAEVNRFFSAEVRPVLSRSLRRAQRRHSFSTDAQRKTFATLCFGTVAHAYRLAWQLGYGDDELAASRAPADAMVAAYLCTVHDLDAAALGAFIDVTVTLRDVGDAPPAARAGLLPTLYDGLVRAGVDASAASATLLKPGPVTLRVNRRKMSRGELQSALREQEGVRTGAPPHFADALVVSDGRLNVRGSSLWQRGAFEVQDAGSQCIVALIEASSGERILDYCAGRGGKALALAARYDPASLQVHDIDTDALAACFERLERAGAFGVSRFAAEAEKLYDWVLVDAPCSSSGTLRRGPDLMWRMQAPLPSWTEQQLAILTAAASHVRPNGRLVYATCSFFTEENEDVRDAFLRTNPHFVPDRDAAGTLRADGTRRLWPHIEGTDAFYMARFRRVS